MAINVPQLFNRRSAIRSACSVPLLAVLTRVFARKLKADVETPPDLEASDLFPAVTWTVEVQPEYGVHAFRWVELPLPPLRWERGRWVAIG